MDARLCVFPSNVVASLAHNYWNNKDHLYHALLKDGHIFVVQGDHCDFTGLDNSDKFPAFASPERHRRLSDYIDAQLALIETLLYSIDVRRSRWAYLIKDPVSGEHRLMQKPHAMYKISYPTWLPRIREGDLQIIRWGLYGDDKALCLWNGKQVEAFFGFEDFSLKKIERMMRGLHALYERKLDYAFEPLAHIMRGDSIVGMVLERVQGRPIEFSDRALVYREFVRMHENHVVFDADLDEFAIVIHHGKMRIARAPFCFHAYSPHQKTERERKLEVMTWKELDIIFGALATRSNYAVFSDSNYALPQFLNYHPDPHRPLYLPKIYEVVSLPNLGAAPRTRKPFNSKKAHRSHSHDAVVACASVDESDNDMSLIISKKRIKHSFPSQNTGSKRRQLLLISDTSDTPSSEIDKGGGVLIVSHVKKRQVSVSSDDSERTLVEDH